MMEDNNIPNNDMNTGNEAGNNAGNQNPTSGQEGNQNPTGGQEGNQNNGQKMDTLLNNTPTVYDFTKSIPEGSELDEEQAKAFGDLIRPMGLSNEQANQIAQYGFKWADQLAGAYQNQIVEQNKQYAEETKKTLGAQFEPTMQKVGVAVEYLEKELPGIKELFASSPVFSNINVVKAMAKFGSLLAEDQGMGGKTNNLGKEDNPYPNTNFDDYK
jgi:hypothetical protein|nr:MAG TPA: hypothetical protein [Caudoviricetes sp.]